jgi:hypothetical protein
VASLTALHFSDVFDSTDIYQLAAHPDSRDGSDDTMPRHLRGRPLFGENTSYESLKAHVTRGDAVKVLTLADDFSEEEQQEYYTYEDLSTQYEEYTIAPLFILKQNGTLVVVSEKDQFHLTPTDRLVALVGEHTPDSSRRPASKKRPGHKVFEVEDTMTDDPTADDRETRST